MWDYCWDSPTSLCTFLQYLNPLELGSGLPTDEAGFPELTLFYTIDYSMRDRKPVLCSTTELPRLLIPRGPKEIRTPDLCLAKALLYQLSYWPVLGFCERIITKISAFVNTTHAFRPNTLISSLLSVHHEVF